MQYLIAAVGPIVFLLIIIFLIVLTILIILLPFIILDIRTQIRKLNDVIVGIDKKLTIINNNIGFIYNEKKV